VVRVQLAYGQHGRLLRDLQDVSIPLQQVMIDWAAAYAAELAKGEASLGEVMRTGEVETRVEMARNVTDTSPSVTPSWLTPSSPPLAADVAHSPSTTTLSTSQGTCATVTSVIFPAIVDAIKIIGLSVRAAWLTQCTVEHSETQ
jgi:hypothetical protein